MIDYAEGVDGSNVGYSAGRNWFGDYAKAYTHAPNTEEFYEVINEYSAEGARISNAIGYAFDSTKVKTELAAVTTVIDTYRPSLECGVVDVDEELPKFLQALEDAGINTIIEENQRQFTEWLSAREVE